MKLWLRRLAYATLLLLWLVIMSFPALAFFLATNGQVQIGQDSRRHVRLFMVQEEEFNGVGVKWQRQVRGHENCWRTSVQYLLWEGENQPANYCNCIDPLTGAPITDNPAGLPASCP